MASLCALFARCSLRIWCNRLFSLHFARQNLAGSDTEHLPTHLPTSNKELKRLIKRRPQPDDTHRLLRVAIIGAPNAGKSTLLNKLISWKVAPVSQKVHTTRCKTLGVLTEDEKQVVFLDTPGIIVPGKMKRHKLQMSLLVDPHIAMFSADIMLVLVDVSHIWHRSRLDPEILKLLQLHANKPSILVLNKVDLLKKKHELLDIVQSLTDGVVGNNVIRPTVKGPDIKNAADLLKKQSCENKSVETAACKPAVYSLQESCELLQNSYDDLYDDDSEETNSVKTDRDCAVTDDVAGPLNSADGCLNQSYTLSSELQDNRTTSSGCTAASDSDFGEPFRLGSEADLYTPDVWQSYYNHLQKIGFDMMGCEGWPKFDAIFMISAVDNDGVFDIKNYLLDRTYPASWVYSSSVVTDQNPVELAKSIIQERLLDHLPDEIPYSLQVRLALWTVDDNYLRASFEIVCSTSRQMRQVLRHIRVISAEAKQELMNAFRREMTLHLVAISLDKSAQDVRRTLRQKKSTQKES